MKIDTRHYAKRQLTWFKADPEVRWFQPGQIEAMAACLEEFFRRNNVEFHNMMMANQMKNLISERFKVPL